MNWKNWLKKPLLYGNRLLQYIVVYKPFRNIINVFSVTSAYLKVFTCLK